MSSRGGKRGFCLQRAPSLVGAAPGSAGEMNSPQSYHLTVKSFRRKRHEPRGSVHTALPASDPSESRLLGQNGCQASWHTDP